MSADAGSLGDTVPFVGRRPDAAGAASPSRRAVRSLLGRNTSTGNHRAPDDPVADLLRSHRSVHARVDTEAIRRAYGIAERAHRGQRRKSGEPYITHPLAVAEICADLGMDGTALVAALLHDTVEDTDYTLERIEKDFTEEVAHLVDGVTKLDKVRFGPAAEAETIRKMILAAGRDPRVLVIKLADRLHNMRTLGFKARASQERIACATRDILVPLAGRLGIHVMKRELEDLAFAILQPDDHAAVRKLVEESAPRREQYVQGVVATAVGDLRAAKIKSRVVPRPRHLRSIYDQMRRPGRPEIEDGRIVIVVRGGSNSIAECYAALGVVHGRWQPVPGRFSDHIGVPKFNMYQSLHTTVIGPEARPMDVMIRTEDMNRVAEYGIVAVTNRASPTAEDERLQLDWLERVLDWQEETDESAEFLSTLCHDLSDHDVLVFSTSGESVSLPADSTPVDFAYACSSTLGDQCFGATVNGQLAPLSSPLSDGDVVEVLTSPSEQHGPSEEWLTFVKSPSARIHIRRWFADESTGRRTDIGRRAIVSALAARDRWLTDDEKLVDLARSLDLPDVDTLCVAVADARYTASDVADRLITLVDGHGGEPEPVEF